MVIIVLFGTAILLYKNINLSKREGKQKIERNILNVDQHIVFWCKPAFIVVYQVNIEKLKCNNH